MALTSRGRPLAPGTFRACPPGRAQLSRELAAPAACLGASRTPRTHRRRPRPPPTRCNAADFAVLGARVLLGEAPRLGSLALLQAASSARLSVTQCRSSAFLAPDSLGRELRRALQGLGIPWTSEVVLAARGAGRRRVRAGDRARVEAPECLRGPRLQRRQHGQHDQSHVLLLMLLRGPPGPPSGMARHAPRSCVLEGGHPREAPGGFPPAGPHGVGRSRRVSRRRLPFAVPTCRPARGRVQP